MVEMGKTGIPMILAEQTERTAQARFKYYVINFRSIWIHLIIIMLMW